MKVYLNLGGKVMKVGDTEIEKQKIHQYRSPILIENIDINKIIVFNKVRLGKKGFKYFIGNKDAKKINHMHISSKNECIQKRL